MHGNRMASFSLCLELQSGTVELIQGTMPAARLPDFCLTVSRLRAFIPHASLYVNARRVDFVHFSEDGATLMAVESAGGG